MKRKQNLNKGQPLQFFGDFSFPTLRLQLITLNLYLNDKRCHQLIMKGHNWNEKFLHIVIFMCTS